MITKEQRRLLKECEWFLSTIGYLAVPLKPSDVESNKDPVNNEQPSYNQLPLLQGTNQE